MGIHELGETLTVIAFKVVRHPVDDDALQIVGMLLGQFDVKPEAAGLAVAGAPLPPLYLAMEPVALS